MTSGSRSSNKWETECERLAEIPGVGRLTAKALVTTVVDARALRSGRKFAAFSRPSPQTTGHRWVDGWMKLFGISKRGDTYLRTLSIHGAPSVLLTQARADRAMDQGAVAKRQYSRDGRRMWPTRPQNGAYDLGALDIWSTV